MKEGYNSTGNHDSSPTLKQQTNLFYVGEPNYVVLFTCVGGGAVLTLLLGTLVLIAQRRQRAPLPPEQQTEDIYENMLEMGIRHNVIHAEGNDAGDEGSDDGSRDDDGVDEDVYDDAASTDMLQTRELGSEGRYTEPDPRAICNHEYVRPGLRVYEVGRDRVHISGTIHDGRFCQIHVGEAWFVGGMDGTTKVAIKIPKEVEDSVTQYGRIRREIELVKSLSSNENITTFLGCCTQLDPAYLIMEYASYGNLKTFLTENWARYGPSDNEGDSKRLRLSFAVDIANGMKYLATKGIVYRALAAKRVLVCDSKLCKISNFSYASGVIDETKAFNRTSQGGLPCPWLALETLTHGTFNTKTDIWSFGVVLWEIESGGCDPYSELDNSDLIMKLRRGHRLSKPDCCEDRLYNLTQSCWAKKPRDRPTFSNLLDRLKELRDYSDETVPLQTFD